MRNHSHPRPLRSSSSLILFLLLFGLSTTTTALPLPDGLTALNSTEGLSLLYAATTLKRPWEEASIHFLTQQDESSCGRASATIVLNTLAAAGVPAGGSG